MAVSQIKQEGLRRFWSMFPLTRVSFWYRFFEPQPYPKCAPRQSSLQIAQDLAVDLYQSCLHKAQEAISARQDGAVSVGFRDRVARVEFHEQSRSEKLASRILELQQASFPFLFLFFLVFIFLFFLSRFSPCGVLQDYGPDA